MAFTRISARDYLTTWRRRLENARGIGGATDNLCFEEDVALSAINRHVERNITSYQLVVVDVANEVTAC